MNGQKKRLALAKLTPRPVGGGKRRRAVVNATFKVTAFQLFTTGTVLV